MATVDAWTVGCAATTTGNQISINLVNRLGSEAYVEIVSEFSVASDMTILVEVYDDCAGYSSFVSIYISTGSAFGSGFSSGFGGCGTMTGSIVSISPEADATYDYHL